MIGDVKVSRKRKGKKKNRITSKNITKKIMFSCTLLFALTMLLVGFSYYLFGTNVLKLGINEKTANYISFNDIFDTDTIRIKNIKQLGDIKGKKSKAIELNIKGDYDNLEYELLLVPINVDVEYKYINYYLTDISNNELINNNLSNCVFSNDYSGLLIYNGRLNGNEDKIKLRMWISEEYSGDIDNNSFEVKIRLK